MLKAVRGKLPWSLREVWHIPASDKHRLDRSFRDGPNDVDSALEMLLPHLTDSRIAIQAGGCIGIWPIRLAQFFDIVYTFEPDPVNFDCMLYNLRGHEGVIPRHAALVGPGTKNVTVHELEPGNAGANYVTEGGPISGVRIDDLKLSCIDLIYLDIEGYEYEALSGASDTIMRCRPVIGVEDKGLGERYGTGDAVKRICDEFGYRVVGKPFSLDVILAPC